MTNCQVFSEKIDCLMESLHSIKSSLPIEERTGVYLENLNLNSAINYLNENGFPISKSTIYKLTCKSAIPFYRFGCRLVFKKSELEDWCKSKIIKDCSSKEGVIAVSTSALKKMHHGKN